MLVVLDSTVLIDFLRGRPVVQRVRDLRKTGDTPATTAINVEEIVRGLHGSEATSARLLLDGLEVLPIDDRSGWQAGTWRREHAAHGTTLSQADCLIAATALTHRARLATGNPKDFPTSGLDVEHWSVGR